jgi:hypothetical protein
MSSTVTNSYLAELTLALRVLPVEVRREIHSGIAEELRGLDAEEASQRIEELGDPTYIAAAALNEVDAGTFSLSESTQDKLWYTLTTVFALLFGSVLALVGWFGGVILLWNSKTWTLRDKIIGTALVPFGPFLPFAFVGLWAPVYSSLSEVNADGSEVFVQGDWDFPAGVGGVILGAVLLIAPFVTFVYLLIRAWQLKKRA